MSQLDPPKPLNLYPLPDVVPEGVCRVLEAIAADYKAGVYKHPPREKPGREGRDFLTAPEIPHATQTAEEYGL